VAAVSQSARVVLADDDERTRAVLRTILSYSPAVEVVGEAADGAEAVKVALERRADVVVLDVNMPGLDGARAAEVIRTYRPRVKVLFHTAEVDNALRRRADALGASILLKGDPEVALHALEELLTPQVERLDPLVAIVVAALERREGDAVLVTDARGRLLFYDSGAADLLDEPFPASGPLEELLQRHPVVYRDGTPRALETIPAARALTERRPVTDEVCELRGDLLRVYEMAAVPVFAEDDNLVGAAAYVRLLPGL
jgi:DNA-binding NarL/FixJ family response regulator